MMEGTNSLMPTRNPLRMEEIEQDMLSSEPGLTYVHELHYSNGAVYRGQIKSVEKLRKEKNEREVMSVSASRNSVVVADPSVGNSVLVNE